MLSFLCCSVFAVFLVGVQSHICLLSPRQRGSMTGLNMNPSDDCFLPTGPCGDRPAGEPSAYLRAGNNFTVVFQKNYGHFFETDPGTLSVNFGVDSTDETPMFETLASMPDVNDDPRTLYTVDVMVCTYLVYLTFLNL